MQRQQSVVNVIKLLLSWRAEARPGWNLTVTPPVSETYEALRTRSVVLLLLIEETFWLQGIYLHVQSTFTFTAVKDLCTYCTYYYCSLFKRLISVCVCVWLVHRNPLLYYMIHAHPVFLFIKNAAEHVCSAERRSWTETWMKTAASTTTKSPPVNTSLVFLISSWSDGLLKCDSLKCVQSISCARQSFINDVIYEIKM